MSKLTHRLAALFAPVRRSLGVGVFAVVLITVGSAWAHIRPVEYIESDGYARIDTGVSISRTMEIRFKCSIFDSSKYHSVFCEPTSGTRTRLGCQLGSATQFAVVFRSDPSFDSKIFTPISASGGIIEGVMNYNSATLNSQTSALTHKDETDNPSSLYLFPNSGARTRFYRFAIYDRNQQTQELEPVIDLVPCYDDETNEGCFYNRVNGEVLRKVSTDEGSITWANEQPAFEVDYIRPLRATGEELCPPLSVYSVLEDRTLVEGEDYVVTYADNVAIGTARALLSGLDNYAYVQNQVHYFDVVQKGQFVPLEYVESAATGMAPINLGFVVDENTMSICVKYAILKTAGAGYSSLFCDRITGVTTVGTRIGVQNGSAQVAMTFCRDVGVESLVATPTLGDDKITEVELNKNGYRLGNANYSRYSASGTRVPCPEPMRVFPNACPEMRVYRFQVKGVDLSGVYSKQLHDFTPCYDTVRQQAGLYDMVERRFYPAESDSTGSLVAGAETKALFTCNAPPAQPYTGKGVEPALDVRDICGLPLEQGVDFEVTYSDNVDVGQGTGKAHVTGKGLFAGAVPQDVTFDIFFDSETRSLAVECLENGGFEDTTIKNNPGKGFWDANNSASAQYAVVAGWGTGFRVGNGGGYTAPSGFKVGTYFGIVQNTGAITQPLELSHRGLYTISYRYAHRRDWNPTEPEEYAVLFTNTAEDVGITVLESVMPGDANIRTESIQYVDVPAGNWDFKIAGRHVKSAQYPSPDASGLIDEVSVLCTAYPDDVYVTHSEPKVAGDDVYRGPMTVTEGMVISAPTRQISIGGGNAVACTGWKIYYYAPVAKAYMAEASRSGEGTTYTVTADDVGRGFILEWQWAPDTLKFVPGDDLITNGGFENPIVTDATRSYWGIKAEPTASTQAIVDGWDGSGNTIVLNGKSAFVPRGKIINGTYCGGVKQTATLTQHLLTGYPAVFTLSYRYLHRDDYQPENAFAYWVSLGEQQLFEETIAGNDNALKTKNVEKIYAPAGDNSLTFESDQTADQMIYLDDVALVCTALPDQFVITHALPVTGDGIQNSVFAVQSGDVFTAPATADLPPEFRVRCTGWKLYRYVADDLAYGAEPIREGAGTTFTVAAEDLQFDANGHLVGLKLEWQWEDLYKLTIEADPNANGTVSIDVIDGDAGAAGATAEAWLATGTKVQMTFHPASAGGYRAIKLTSDQPADIARPTMNTVTFTVEKKNVSFVTGDYGFDDGYLVADDPTVAVTMPYGDRRRVYVFTNVAVKALSVFALRDLTYQESLVLAGGGAGGMWGNSGGGGAGGLVRDSSARLLEKGACFTLQVGKGGAGGTYHASTPMSGENSALNLAGLLFTAIGGGRGNSGWRDPGPGAPGGCGGGGGSGDGGTVSPGKGTPGQGFDGGAYVYGYNIGAGGGGTDAVGGTPAKTAGTDTYHGGKGGDGRLDMITGVMHCYGSGGGGAAGGKTFDGSGNYIDAPGEGGRESGGRAGVEVLPAVNPDGKYTYGGQNGKDGLGGGGGACGNKSGYKSGSGGCGTVILAFALGDTTARQFACDLVSYPAGETGATPEPVIRNAKTGAALVKDVDYTLDYENNLVEGHAKLVVKGAGDYADVVQRFDFEVTGVRYVTPDAPEDGTGEDWAHPMNLTNAVNGLTNKTYEIWCQAGTYVFPTGNAPITVSRAMTLRGGFSGNAVNVAEKDPNGEKSIFDGEGKSYQAFEFNYSVGAANFGLYFIKFADVTFMRFKDTVLHKTDSRATPLHFENCDFLCNTKTDGGRGYATVLHVSDNRNNSVCAPITFTGCRFLGNVRSGWSVSGVDGILNFAYADVTIENCLFATNGVSASTTVDNNISNCGLGCGLVRQEGGSLKILASRIVGNVYAGTRGYCSQIFATHTETFLMKNCVFAGNTHLRSSGGDGSFGALVLLSPSSTGQTTIESCTFAYNIADGGNQALILDWSYLNNNYGPLEVKNCIFWGNRYGSANQSKLEVNSGKGTISYSLLPSLDAGASITPARAGEGLVSFDPCFVSEFDETLIETMDGSNVRNCLRFVPERIGEIIDFDFHLRSPAAYSLNDGTRVEDDDIVDPSPALDKGDPAADYSNEPEPNGYRLNLGAYGNTAEASETPFADPALLQPEIEYETPYTQPTVILTMGGDGKFTVPVTLLASEDGQTWVEAGTIQMKNGDEARVLVPLYFPVGGKIYLKTAYEFDGEDHVASYEPVEVAEGKTTPPWYNVPGLEHVVYLRPGATGRATGNDWTDACTTLQTALTMLQGAGKTELWIEGTNILDAAVFDGILKKAFSKKIMIRGGFAGMEATADARVKGARSVLDGADEAGGIVLEDTSYPIAIENLVFTRATLRGLNLNVKGAAITNCVFTKNGPVGSGDYGRGLYVQSDAYNGAKVVLSGCTFAENIQTNANDWGVDGMASYFKYCNLYMDDCLFVSNGTPFMVGSPNGSASGSAVYLNNSSLRATGCRFIANRARISGNEGGGVVFAPWMDGGFKGRVYCFTNCLFLANEMLGTQNARNPGCGGVFFQCWQTAVTAEVVNCTFAYNLSEFANAGAGFSSPSGSGRLVVKNSIFHGNVNRSGVNADINMDSVTSAEVTYNYFDSTNNIYGLANNAAKVCTNNLYGVEHGIEPGLISTTNDFFNLIKPTVTKTDGWRYLDWNEPEKIMALNVHLRGPGGYIDETTGEKVIGSGKQSPCVDAGDPKSNYKRETKPRGRRANMGFYGNTPWATFSPDGMAVRVR